MAAALPRAITRYLNRKLYDAAEGRYVTLEDLRARVVAGEELEVVDQKTGEDLTTLTLAQILLEGLRGSTARVPRRMLAGIIRLAFGPRIGGGEDTAEGPRAALKGLEQRLERLDRQIGPRPIARKQRAKTRPAARRPGRQDN